MDETILTLTHAIERDIDLILVEELKCCKGFMVIAHLPLGNCHPTLRYLSCSVVG